jgi:HD-GYP domain-containing protein (c-di-GMP phosphodiesterase class II)
MGANASLFGDTPHDRRVARLSMDIGRELAMSPSSQEVLGRSGLLHDIGKLGIPQSILVKNGALTESEWRIMKTHPELGVTILGETGRFTREKLAVLYHHERMDGSGYPHGLTATDIPIEARIVAVADTYDVLTSDRPYRRAFNQSDALRRIFEEAGPHLDPSVVTALIRTLVTGRSYRYVA